MKIAHGLRFLSLQLLQTIRTRDSTLLSGLGDVLTGPRERRRKERKYGGARGCARDSLSGGLCSYRCVVMGLNGLWWVVMEQVGLLKPTPPSVPGARGWCNTGYRCVWEFVVYFLSGCSHELFTVSGVIYIESFSRLFIIRHRSDTHLNWPRNFRRFYVFHLLIWLIYSKWH